MCPGGLGLCCLGTGEEHSVVAQRGLLGSVGTAPSPWCFQGTLQLSGDANSSGSTGVILPRITACLYNPVDGCWLKMEEEGIVS